MIALTDRTAVNQIGGNVIRGAGFGSRDFSRSNGSELGEVDKKRKSIPLKHNLDERPTLIIVEHRDEVYARIAADLSHFGVDIVRSESVFETRVLANRCDSALIIINRDLPDESGWVLADKLRRLPQVEVWMYFPEASTYAKVLAEFQRVRELIEYHGDLFTLSDLLMERLEDWRCAAVVTDEMHELLTA